MPSKLVILSSGWKSLLPQELFCSPLLGNSDRYRQLRDSRRVRSAETLYNSIDEELVFLVIPVELVGLSIEDCIAVMAYLMFLKGKYNCNIKAQGWCDGRVQRNYMTKEDTSPPSPSRRRSWW